MNNFVFVDTNILIYIQDKTSIKYEESVDIFIKLNHEKKQMVISPFVVNELHYHYLKNYGFDFSKKACLDVISFRFIKLLDFEMKQNDLKICLEIANKYNLKTFDSYHAYYCKKLKIKQIATFDDDFKRIPWLKIYE